MAKDPAFLFYPNDYIGGTMGMTFEQKGAYMELLMLQFNRGHMTSHMIGQVLGQDGGQLWDTLKDKFIIDKDGKYYNERLSDEKQKRKAFTESRRNNIIGINQYTKKEPLESGHMTSHMEDENRNRNKDINRKSFKKALDLYIHCKKPTSAKLEWDQMTESEHKTALIHIPKFRKIFKDENRIRYLWDFKNYLYEKMYLQDLDTFKDQSDGLTYEKWLKNRNNGND